MVSFAAALVILGAPKSAALSSHVSALQAAQELTATLKVQEVGGGATSFVLNLAKPNKARIDGPDSTIIADGTTMTVFIKSEKSYYKKPQTEEGLFSQFQGSQLQLFLPFFKGDALDSLTSLKDGPAKRGMKTALGSVGKVKTEIFFDAASGIAKQATYEATGSGGTSTSVLNVSAVGLKNPADETFAFAAPSGSKEIDEAELLSDKWLSFSEGLSRAKSFKKLMLVDFMASWCGPCKMMDAEVFHSPEFKTAAKGLVLAKVDGDLQPDLTQHYGVDAYPTVKFIDGNGNVVHEFVGYGGKEQVLAEIKTARQKAGL